MDLSQAPPAVRKLIAAPDCVYSEQMSFAPTACVDSTLEAYALSPGIDAGVGPWVAHGYIHRRVSQLEDAGLSPAEAVAAATSEAAPVCGLQHRKGLLRKGYDADLILTDGVPQTDLTALRRVRLAVLAGKSVG